jgi:MFS family permease
VLFTLGSAACALSPTASALIAARAVQGLGGAAVLPLSLTILTAAFPAQRRGTIVGIYGGLAGLGIAIGPLVGGAVTEGLDWHWIFWVNVPIGTAVNRMTQPSIERQDTTSVITRCGWPTAQIPCVVSLVIV